MSSRGRRPTSMFFFCSSFFPSSHFLLFLSSSLLFFSLSLLLFFSSSSRAEIGLGGCHSCFSPFLCHYASGHPSNPRKTTRWATEGAQGRARHTPVCGFAILFIAFQATCVIHVAVKLNNFIFCFFCASKKHIFFVSCEERLHEQKCRIITFFLVNATAPFLPHFYWIPLWFVMFERVVLFSRS